MIACSRCGQENPDGFRFCGACGAPLGAEAALREERKIVTVLFCDLVGFTSRAERLDPEDVRALLSPYYARLRSELERRGGTVEKFIGDAVVALFGAPVSHEDDPERAVRAALAIRDSILDEETDLQVRIGITTGEALVALGARPREGEGMASGDVVNTAARLQAGAPVNGILVDETTYRATDQVIDYRDAETVQAKGKLTPIAVWEAVEAWARLGVDIGRTVRTALVGRRNELELLRTSFTRTRAELSPQLVTLVGVPGIGKTRLVHEFFVNDVDSVPDLIYWRQGRSLPYGEGISFWALAEMAKAHAGILETDAAEQAAAKLHRAVALSVEDPAESAWVESHLRPLVGLESEAEWTEDRRTEAFAAWRRLFEAMAERSPLVLVFEDLQWADDGLLDFVDYLAGWVSGVPLLVICTGRPELLARRPEWGGGKANATTISLSALSDEETARLLAALLERPVLPAETQQALLLRAGGNPLYAEQYARLLSEHGEGEELPLPETVQGIIAARLDGLSPEEKRLLHDASVVGRVFWTGALVAMGDGASFAVEERLHSLARKEFVRRERRSSVAGESEYVFQHLLVRDVAYGQIPRAYRAEKHRLAAEWIESLSSDRSEDRAEMLAHHYSSALDYARAAGRASDVLADRARLALREAGDRASGLNAFAAAVRFYRAALELWPADDPERAKVLFSYARVLSVTEAGGAGILIEARDAVLALGDAETAAEAEILLAEIAQDEGRNDGVRVHLKSAVELVENTPSTPTKVYVLSSVSRFLMVGYQAEEAIRVGREALEMADELGLDLMRAHALNNIGSARLQIGDDGGVADLERSIEIADSINSPESVRAYSNLATSLAWRGDLHRSWQLKAQARRLADRFGHAPHARWMRGEQISELYWRGSWEEAFRLADEFVAESEAGPRHYLECIVRSVRGRIRIARDDLALALEEADRAVELAEEARDAQAVVPALAFSAFVRLAWGRRSEAELLLDRALAAGHILLGEDAALELVWLLEAFGRPDELASSLRANVSPLWQDAARAILSRDFARAADLSAELGLVTEEAYARLRAAEALAGAGRRPEADEQLAKALAFYRSVGATAYIRRGEALLAASA